jgi:transposase
MSKLKQQLKVILPNLAQEANQCRDTEAKRRYYLIKAVAESPKSVLTVCQSRGLSTDYFYKWAKRLLKQRSLTALMSGSRRPKRSPKQTAKRIEKRIVAMRKAEPYLGADRIAFELKRLFNMVCAVSSVHAVLRRRGLITKNYRERLTKKHVKRYRRGLPGFCQTDVKYVPQFNFVDHCTTWRFTRIYASYSHEIVREFLRELEHTCPFPIIEIQTDNGTEFTDKYRGGRLTPSGLHVLDLWCKDQSIRHRLIPIGQKELNGKVENTHKQDDREFYSQNVIKNLLHARTLILSYNERWNTLRYTKALGRKTPDQALEAAYVRVTAWASLIQEKYATQRNELISWDQDLNASMPVPKPPKQTLRPSGPRRKTSVNRYLEYLEWEKKKSS